MHVAWPRTFSRPPGAHIAAAASRSCASIASKYRRATASALLPEIRLRVASPSCCMFAATSCTFVARSRCALSSSAIARLLWTHAGRDT